MRQIYRRRRGWALGAARIPRMQCENEDLQQRRERSPDVRQRHTVFCKICVRKGYYNTCLLYTSFSVGLSNDGNLYIWGNTAITNSIDIADIPDEIRNANIVDIAVGNDHALAIDDAGRIYVWGNTRQGQDKIPEEVENLSLIHIFLALMMVFTLVFMVACGGETGGSPDPNPTKDPNSSATRCV